MHSEQRDRCSVFLENDVVAGIDRGDGAVRRISTFVLFKIIRDRSPASYVVPIKSGLHDENAIRFLHDRVIERDTRQFAEPLTQSFIEISNSAQLRNEISQFRRVTVEFAKHRRHGPDEHSRVPSKISSAQK